MFSVGWNALGGMSVLGGIECAQWDEMFSVAW